MTILVYSTVVYPHLQCSEIARPAAAVSQGTSTT